VLRTEGGCGVEGKSKGRRERSSSEGGEGKGGTGDERAFSIERDQKKGEESMYSRSKVSSVDSEAADIVGREGGRRRGRRANVSEELRARLVRSLSSCRGWRLEGW